MWKECHENNLYVILKRINKILILEKKGGSWKFAICLGMYFLLE